jgi:dTDP-glucose pyrophosphorylase
MKAIIILSVPNNSLTEETRETFKNAIPDSVAVVLVEETANPEKWGITIVHDETIKVIKL